MSLSTIIILPILTAFGLLWWGNQIKDEHPLLTFIFQLLFLPMMYISFHFAVIQATLIYASEPTIVELLADLTYYLGWVLFIVGAYYCFMLFKGLYDSVKQHKEDKKREMYGD
jgi:hypothetical protein